MRAMKVMLLLTGSGPLVILTASATPTAPELLQGLAEKGIEKFIAYEIPIELAKQRYGAHFAAVANDVHETDRLRILDANGQRAFALFDFEELGQPTRYQAR